MSKRIEDTPLGIWTCKIGEAGVMQTQGLDSPMRKAVRDAFYTITGEEPDFVFSGWRGELTEGERAVVENRVPVEGLTEVTLTQAEFDALNTSDRKLAALEAAGVDNWEGYGDAMRDFYGDSE